MTFEGHQRATTWLTLRISEGKNRQVRRMLLAVGSRHVSATRSALFGVIDTPLGPLWMWLAFAEVPSVATVIGGTIVLAAVLADILLPRGRRNVREELGAD